MTYFCFYRLPYRPASTYKLHRKRITHSTGPSKFQWSPLFDRHVRRRRPDDSRAKSGFMRHNRDDFLIRDRRHFVCVLSQILIKKALSNAELYLELSSYSINRNDGKMSCPVYVQSRLTGSSDSKLHEVYTHWRHKCCSRTATT